MLILLVLSLVILMPVNSKKESVDSDPNDLGDNLVAAMRNDANLDLSADEEYEDLRAEFLAYRTALATLSSNPMARRSMMSTPCWSLGGICIEYNMCKGFRYLTEVPGCKNRLNVCCFVWNTFKKRDMRDKGISTGGLPWSANSIDFGGRGVIDIDTKKKKKLVLKKDKNNPKLTESDGSSAAESIGRSQDGKKKPDKALAIVVRIK